MMKKVLLFEQFNETVNEAFKANSGLGKALIQFKKDPAHFEGDKKIIDRLIELKVTSNRVFEFAAMFPRDTFKIEDIRKGKLEAQIKRIFFDGENQKTALAQAAALKEFVLALDKQFGEKNWTSKF